MFSNKVFQIALLISFATHTVILFQNPNLNFFQPKGKNDNKVEVRYLKPAEGNRLASSTAHGMEPFLKLNAKITAKETTPSSYISREDFFKKNQEIISRKFAFTKPSFMKPEIIAIKKKIILSAISIDKNSSPSYVAHSQIVREKIKRALYQNYNRMEVGQVYLTFILTNDGSLKDVQLLEEKSTGSAYLKEIALRSIKDASPFPHFPSELDYEQLTFNVIVSFEVE